MGTNAQSLIRDRTLPRDDAAYGKQWGIIKAHVSRRCGHLLNPDAVRSESRIRRGELGFWQRRFREYQIRDDRDFERCINYIHYNPVKHQLVKRVADWPHSTFHRFVTHGAYPENWSADPGIVSGNAGE